MENKKDYTRWTRKEFEALPRADRKNNLVNTGVLTYSLGIPKLDIPKIDRTAVTKWQD